MDYNRGMMGYTAVGIVHLSYAVGYVYNNCRNIWVKTW
jgi:hypothetical protein